MDELDVPPERYIVNLDVMEDPGKKKTFEKNRSTQNKPCRLMQRNIANFLISTCVSSIYTSTYGQITKEFNVSRLIATLGLSCFIFGMGLGPMFLGPLS